MVTIYSDGALAIDGIRVGRVGQYRFQGTVVTDTRGEVVPMPEHRYSLACDAPASGVPGRRMFEADLVAAFAEMRQ